MAQTVASNAKNAEELIKKDKRIEELEYLIKQKQAKRELKSDFPAHVSSLKMQLIGAEREGSSKSGSSASFEPEQASLNPGELEKECNSYRRLSSSFDDIVTVNNNFRVQLKKGALQTSSPMLLTPNGGKRPQHNFEQEDSEEENNDNANSITGTPDSYHNI